MEEILICPKCKSEYSLYYQDDVVVSKTRCKCKEEIRKLDVILNSEEFKNAIRKINKQRTTNSTN